MTASLPGSFQYRCPFCLNEDKTMVDPRLLPCKHEVCLPCLKEYLKCRPDPQCEQCGVTFDPAAVGDFPILSVVPCKTCASRRIDVTAVNFCLQCMKPMCHQHTEIHHADHEDDNHEVITMYQYLRVEQKLNLYFCSKHPSMKLDGRCAKCLEFDCINCRSFAHHRCPKGDNHTSVDLPDVKGQLTTQVERLLQAVDHLMLIKMEAAQKISDTQKQCDDLKMEAERQSEQQRKDAVHLALQQIDIWSNATITRLIEDSSEIDQRLPIIQQLLQKATNLCTETHVLDILKGELDDQLKRDIDAALKEMPQAMVILDKLLVQKENIQFRLVNKKPAITVTKMVQVAGPHKAFYCRRNIPVAGWAYCVSHTADGQLVVGRNGGFDLFDESGEILHSVETRGGDITGLSLYKGFVYVIHKASKPGTERQVQKYSLPGKNMTSWKVPDHNLISQLAIVQGRVYTRSNGDNLLLAYSHTGEQQPEHNIPLPAVSDPNYLCAASPDGLIISDWKHSLVAKYTTSGQHLWTYKGLNICRGACIDVYNRVWVASEDSMIHILSPSGQLICELTHPDLKCPHHLSIFGDQLACAANDKGLLLYHIDYHTFS